MTDDDDLRINTLHRFEKHSPRLILHEYSHCEVPAGCGGVVLRWIDAAKGWPAQVQLLIAHGSGTVWLDGVELASSFVQLRPGRRTIGIRLSREQPQPRPFKLVAFYDDRRERDVVAGGAPRWRCSTAAPPDGWAEPAFEDAHWPLVPLATDALVGAQDGWLRSSFERHAAAGGTAFALDTDELWVRLQFTAPEPPQ